MDAGPIQVSSRRVSFRGAVNSVTKPPPWRQTQDTGGLNMYIAMVISLMLIFPIASIALEFFTRGPGALDVAIIGKWFVFWAVGVRLLIAGLRQIVQPRYTAETILGVKNPDAMLIVRELGIANTAIGSAGLGSLFFSGWTLPLAVIGAIFYGLAGINHFIHKGRNKLQNVAMTSDLFASAILLTIFFAMKPTWLP
jgi:hypothetical protein